MANYDTDYNDIACKIRNLRKSMDMTLEEVANIVGVGKSTVRKWEKGMIKNMRRDKIVLLAKALQTTPSYLLGWTQEETSSKNNTIANIVKDLRTDDMFLSIVEKIYNMDNTQRSTINQMLSAFEIKKE